MCELLDTGMPSIKFTIVGPGWVNTKIHYETLSAGPDKACENYHKTLAQLRLDDSEKMQRIVAFINWLIEQPKSVIGGRNFSIEYDDTENRNFIETAT